MTTEEIVTAWRKWGKQGSDMVRIRKSVLKNINLPEETKLFLNQGGLVDTVYGGTLVPTLPRLTDLVAKAEVAACCLPTVSINRTPASVLCAVSRHWRSRL